MPENTPMPRLLIGSLVAYVLTLPVLGAPTTGVIVGKSIRLADLAFVAVGCAFLAAGRGARVGGPCSPRSRSRPARSSSPPRSPRFVPEATPPEWRSRGRCTR
jgi:hypothetical protein